MPAYNKPYLCPDQQIELLMSRGMRIDNVAKARTYLERIGYYRLSAYWYPFRNSKLQTNPQTGQKETLVTDNFKDGANFSKVIKLYVFDKKLRMLVLDALERIEVSFRTDIALTIGKHDIRAHRVPKYLHGNFAIKFKKNSTITEHEEWLDRQDKNFKNSREDFAKHFKIKYLNDTPPIWISTEVWDFGALSRFYGGLTINDGDAIAQSYGLPNKRTLSTWLRSLNDSRNICAHHSRLWNKPLVNIPSWPRSSFTCDLDHIANDRHSQTRLYATLLALRFLLKTINPNSTWGARLIDHVSTFPSDLCLNLTQAGFPNNWRELPIWAI